MYCGQPNKKPYDIVDEIKNVLNEHPVPLSAKEIQRYLENANYDKLEYYITIQLEHLDKLLQDLTEVEIIRYVDDGNTYYMTRTQINKRHNKI
jgi:hypothetical protein